MTWGAWQEARLGQLGHLVSDLIGGCKINLSYDSKKANVKSIDRRVIQEDSLELHSVLYFSSN